MSEWTEVLPGSGGNYKFAKWPDPGAVVEGAVLSYDHDSGGSTYQGDECGHLLLDPLPDDSGLPPDPMAIMVTLDKQALISRVAAAKPVKGMRMRIVWEGWAESPKTGRRYKTWKVYAAPAVPTAAAPAPPPAPQRPAPAPVPAEMPF